MTTMATTSSSFESKLPPEIRAQIYEIVLMSESPLRRPNAQTPPSSHVHTPILTLNKRINLETADTFYELNIFVLHLADVLRTGCAEYYAAVNTEQLDKRPYGNLQLVCDARGCASNARDYSLVGALRILRVLRHLNEVPHPKLRATTFRLESSDYKSVSHFLGETFGPVLKFTAVGRFELDSGLPNEPKIKLLYPSMAQIWDHHAGLQPDHAHLSMWNFDVPSHMKGLPPSSWPTIREAKVWLLAYYADKGADPGEVGEQWSWASHPRPSEKLKEVAHYLTRAV